MLAGVFLRENAVKPDCKRGMFHHRPGWRGFAILVFLIRLIPLYFLSCTEIRGRMLHAFQILVAFLWHRSRGHARYSFPSSPASAPVSVPADRVLQSHVILLSFYEVVVSNHTRVFFRGKVQNPLQCWFTSEGAADNQCCWKKMLL